MMLQTRRMNYVTQGKRVKMQTLEEWVGGGNWRASDGISDGVSKLHNNNSTNKWWEINNKRKQINKMSKTSINIPEEEIRADEP